MEAIFLIVFVSIISVAYIDAMHNAEEQLAKKLRERRAK